MGMISGRLCVVLGAGLLALAGCGGGGGGGSGGGGDDPPAPVSSTITGVAATGAPFTGATVTLYDRNSTVVGTTTVAVDGSYTLVIPSATPAPLVLEAARDGEVLVSAAGDTAATRINITPLTNLIAARLAPDGNPLSLRTNAAVATPENLSAQVEQVQAMLKPLLDAVADTVNPLTGTFSANGSGHDKVLDSIAVDIRPTGSGSNIEVTVKVAGEGTVSTSFTSAQAVPPPITATIAAADLPPDNLPQMLEDLRARLQACYALPLDQRVSGVGPGATSATGGASSVIAPACRTLFLGDDPATYLNGGARVGRDVHNNGAFTGLFRSGATGVGFDSVRFEFLRNNPQKDVVFSYRNTNAAGSESYETLVARVVSGQLKIVGNQYAYSSSIRPFAQDREFLNQEAASYISVGYDITIANRLDGDGHPVFSKVVVTTPAGNTVTMAPNAGRGQLQLVRSDGTVSGVSTLRLAGRFKNPATSGTPMSTDTGAIWASPSYTDEQIRALKEQGVWRLEFFHADASLPNVVQTHRTFSRAPTLNEFAAMQVAQLTDAAKAEIRAESASSGVLTFDPSSPGQPNVAELRTAGGGDFWTVPAGALAPNAVTIFGAGPDPDGSGPLRGAAFDDTQTFSPAARSVVVACSRQGVADTHCDSNGFVGGSTVTNIQLYATTSRFVLVGKANVTGYLLPR